MRTGTAWAASRRAHQGKPAGGFAFVRVRDLCRLWQAYREGGIRFCDVRTWFAAQELVARRCECEADEPKRFTFGELERLVGGNGREASVRRLERAGLLTWTDRRVAVPEPKEPASEAISAMLEAVVNSGRLVPLPRRTLRLLAQTGKPVIVASILGHLVRCVYYRQGQVISWGTCKASWIAETFRVDLRNVKRARKHLLGIGWLEERDSPHWHRQRWGGSYVVNLTWSRPASYTECASIPPHASTSPVSPALEADGVTAGDTRYRTLAVPSRPESELPPLPPISAPVLPPPSVNWNLPTEAKNQKPASGGPSGVFKEKGRGVPSWKHVEVEDLRDTKRLLVVFGQATATGVIGRSEHERLLFVSAAEHALLKGTRNPCGLFVDLVRRKRWNYCTQDDEDAARERLNRALFGKQPEWREIPTRLEKPVLSEDEKLAWAAAAVARQKRIDPLPVVRQFRPDWTRQKFEEVLGQAEKARMEAFGVRPGWTPSIVSLGFPRKAL